MLKHRKRQVDWVIANVTCLDSKSLWVRRCVCEMTKLGNTPAPAGMKWIFCRYRKVRGSSNKELDAHEYGYEAWAFLVRA